MADFQLIQCKKTTKKSSKSQNVAIYKDAGITKSNASVRIFTRTS